VQASRDLPFEIHAGSEPRWARANNSTLYYIKGNALKRYDVASGAKAVEDDLSFEDVQNHPGGNRSEIATFYLKSTHVDAEGRATINLTDNSDVVIIDKVIAEDGRAQARVNINGLYLAYDMDMTSLTINCFNGSDVVTFAPGTETCASAKRGAIPAVVAAIRPLYKNSRRFILRPSRSDG